MATRARPRLDRAQWIAAALAALRGGGLSAVAVEPLAAELGTTKGSFYWHFTNREDLVAATLAHWEQVATIDPITELAEIADPAARLRRLFDLVIRNTGTAAVEVALLADVNHRLAGETLRRVSERRLAFMTDSFRELGVSPARARQQALAAYAAYLGIGQLQRQVPEVVARDQAGLRRALLRDLPEG